MDETKASVAVLDRQVTAATVTFAATAAIRGFHSGRGIGSCDVLRGWLFHFGPQGLGCRGVPLLMMESVCSGLKGKGLQAIGRWQKGARETRRGIEVAEKGESGDRGERRVGEPEGQTGGRR